MKTLKRSMMVIMTAIVTLFSLKAQSKDTNIGKPKLAVISIDSKGLSLDQEQTTNLTRMEIEKLGMFEVTDRYDVADLTAKNNINPSACFGKTCLVEAGKVLGVEKMFSGSIEKYGEKKIIVTFRMIDVASSSLEKTQVKEFLNLQDELQTMISTTLKTMLNIPTDTVLIKQLSTPYAFESALSKPGVSRLRSDGPRMGLTIILGAAGERLRANKNEGGYDLGIMMTQFGYQFETQYLNEGNFQALFEFIPIISGIDQGRFIPSLTIMNGFRNNKNGLEFAFGPTFSFVKKAEGYYDERNQWHMSYEWNQTDSTGTIIRNPNPIIERVDSRGDLKLNSGFVFAAGKTFRSGSLNIPVNAYVVPDFKEYESWQVGVSFGFNVSDRKKNTIF